jgi:hypothetical protein
MGRGGEGKGRETDRGVGRGEMTQKGREKEGKVGG